MSTIDKSVEDLIDTAEGFGRGVVSVENVELARLWLHSMIAAALEDAERKGAEAMRDAVAAEFDRRDGGTGIGFYDPHEPAEIVRDLPLPTGERQAVLLTDEQIERAVDGHGWTVSELQVEDIPGMARDIEAAVLAANNLEVRRG